jgi:hypothetical protein
MKDLMQDVSDQRDYLLNMDDMIKTINDSGLSEERKAQLHIEIQSSLLLFIAKNSITK